MGPNYQSIIAQVEGVRSDVRAIQERTSDIPWYPYDSFANFYHLADLLSSVDHLFAEPRRMCDIGAADGAVAFTLERAGHNVDVYDFGPTNYNTLRGVRRLKEELQSKVNIYEKDLDSNFTLEGRYDFGVFLGILYHLKNPYYALETLGRFCDNIVVSTRICRHFRRGGPDVADIAAAYLLNPDESNNDPTNYWVFTMAGLERIFARTGWRIVAGQTVGDTVASNPQDSLADERFMGVLTRV